MSFALFVLQACYFMLEKVLLLPGCKLIKKFQFSQYFPVKKKRKSVCDIFLPKCINACFQNN